MTLKNRKIYYTILTAVICIIAINIHAAFVSDIPYQITQPDGTVINALITGDEFYRWIHTADGFTIIQDPQTKYYVWAKEVNGDLVSTGIPIHTNTSRSASVKSNENISNEKYLEIRNNIQNIRSLGENTTRNTTEGNINQLVIFIRFAGEPEFEAGRKAYFEEIFNANSLGSLKNYYLEASYGLLDVTSHFFPVQTTSEIVSYETSVSSNIFWPYDEIDNPDGYLNSEQVWDRECELIAEILTDIAPQVPPTLNIDSDNDGFIDNIVFIVRGNSGPLGTMLWHHMAYDSEEWIGVEINGKMITRYNVNIEFYGAYPDNKLIPIDTIAHEFGHSVGFPDYYRYNGNPLGVWSIMASGGNSSISAYDKAKYTNWIPPIERIEVAGTYTLHPLSTQPSENATVAYRINTGNSFSEYFVVEYRKNTLGTIDATLPGSGLLVYRVNTLAGRGNVGGPPDELYLYRPGGDHTTGVDSAVGDITQAFFSADVGRTSITDFTSPSAYLQLGGPSGISITNISFAGDTISFDVDGFNNDDEWTPSNYYEPLAGTEFNPIQISTIKNLQWVSFSRKTWWRGDDVPVHFVQTADIDATETADWVSGEIFGLGFAIEYGFVPLGYSDIAASTSLFFFNGVYDGGGFTISNLTLISHRAFTSGFIAEGKGATIKNLRLENINNQTESYRAGGIAGQLTDSIVENCFVSGTIVGYPGSSAFCGAIAGYMENSIISKSGASATVSSGWITGGIAGIIYGADSRIENCFTASTIIGNAAGGIVGSASAGVPTIINNYFMGDILNSNYVGAIVGSYSSSTLLNNFWNSPNPTDYYITSSGNMQPQYNSWKSKYDFKQPETFINSGWDFENIWMHDPNKNFGYPYHEISSTVTLPTPIDLQVTFTGLSIELTWSAPIGYSDGVFQNYVIYKNGELLETIPSTNFTDTDFGAESEILYAITAMYDLGESGLIKELLVKPSATPPENLTGVYSLEGVVLEWEMSDDSSSLQPSVGNGLMTVVSKSQFRRGELRSSKSKINTSDLTDERSSPLHEYSLKNIENDKIGGHIQQSLIRSADASLRGTKQSIPYSLSVVRNDYLIGYNVYRNSTLLTTDPITDLIFTDQDPPLGLHTYSVTAEYIFATSLPISTEVLVGFTTNIDIQDFSGTPPDGWAGWTRMNGELTQNSVLTNYVSSDWTYILHWGYANFGNDASHPNGRGVRINVYGTTMRAWLISPEIILSDPEAIYSLSFDYGVTGHNNTNPVSNIGEQKYMSVVISTDNGLTWSSDNTLIQFDNFGSPNVLNNVSNTGQKFTVDLSAYSGSIKVGFYGHSAAQSPDIDFHLDNFVINKISPINILPPENLLATAGDSEINLSWDPPQSIAGLNGYNIYRDEQLCQSEINTTTYIDTGLTNGQTYTYYVTAVYTLAESEPSNTQITTPLAPGNLIVTPPSYDFGIYYVGAISESQTFTITNNGGSPLLITCIDNRSLIIASNNTTSLFETKQIREIIHSLHRDNNLIVDQPEKSSKTKKLNVLQTTRNTRNPDFHINYLPAMPATLNPDESISFTVAFTPQTPGIKSDQIIISHSANSTPFIINLSGTSLGLPVFSINPEAYDFGNIVIGQTSESQTFTITNTGGSPLTVAAISDCQTADFAMSLAEQLTLPTELGVNESMSFTVTFAPLTVGSKTDQITITHNAAGSPVTVNLSGQAENPVFNPPQNLTAIAGDTVVHLTWESPEVQEIGIFLGYQIYRDGVEMLIDILETTTYSDNTVTNGIEYEYYIVALYTSPVGESEPSNTVTVKPESVDEVDVELLPNRTALLGNYPNPFNPTTTIKFSLKMESNIVIDIYNIKGQRVKKLLHNHLAAGNHSVYWNGKDDHGREVVSGVYFYMMQTEDFYAVKRLILMK